MKKLVLSLVIAAFAVAVQAADDSSCGSCCGGKNTKQAKSTCTKSEKGMKQASASAKPLKSPKANS